MIQFRRSYFENFDKEKIAELIDLVRPYLDHRKDLYHRYSRKASPNEMMQNEEDRVVVAFEYYIVNMARGYFSGNPPVYTVTESPTAEQYQEAIDHIRRYNDDAATFTEAIHDYLVTSAAYLYITENENSEIVYTRFDSLETVCIYDYGLPPYPIAVVRLWTEEDIEKIEITTWKSRRIFDSDGNALQFEDYVNGEEALVTEKMLDWQDVPVTAFENPDGMAIFEPAIDMIDAHETLVTNARNMTQYNDMAKLIIKGYDKKNPMFVDILDSDGEEVLDIYGNPQRTVNPAWKQEEKELFEARALFLDNDGSVEWLLKEVNYTGILALMKKLEELITMTTNIPNMTDESFARAASGVAMGYKLYALDQYAATLDRVFKRGYLRLWEIVTNRLNLKWQKSFDFRDIDVVFNRNVPTDRDKEVERAVTAMNSGLASRVTAISMSGIDVEADSEEVRIMAEKRRIANVQDVISLYKEGLMDRQTAIDQIFQEDQAAEVFKRLIEEDISAEDDQINDQTTADDASIADDQTAVVAENDVSASTTPVRGAVQAVEE